MGMMDNRRSVKGNMKNRKVVGLDTSIIPVEIWKKLGSWGIGWITRFINKILV